MKNLLITSVSRKVELIKAFTNETKKENIKLFGTDISQDAIALFFCDDYFISKKTESSTYLEELILNCKKRNIGYILPTSDKDLIYFSKNKEKLTEHNIQTIISPKKTIEICTSKINFNNYCLKNNLPVPKTYKNLKEALFPLVIKEEFSQASKGVYIAKNQKELEHIESKIIKNKYLVQEYIEGKEYSIDAFFDENGILKNALARSRDLVNEGESIITTTVDLPILIDLVKKLGKSLRFFGHLVVQAFYVNNCIYLVEVNPRFGGASSISFAAGINSPKWLVEYLAGKPLHQPIKTKKNLKMYKYSSNYIMEDKVDY